MDRQVPDWKRTAFNRLLHRVGLANKFTNRHTCNAEKDDLPWGQNLSSPQMVGGELTCQWGVEVPEWVPKVAPAPKAKPKDVQALGRTRQAKEIRWGRLAAEVGLSRQAQVLQNAAYIRNGGECRPAGAGKGKHPLLLPASWVARQWASLAGTLQRQP